MFHEELVDYNQEKYTQGFGDGYKMGFQHGGESLKKFSKDVYDFDL